ncbi:MFS general substrate transporter [Cucurbitaria berberidis CBS 394.84]|uniref:MFS general substrate transporter n=1 Tax=Cucurbitaria berberidis CBS 394.84 TaxID=1168544 RepID=A0A9P4L9X6_9PLEO|nr:MFS general substrate transporter [Cucurbitaria berberidis CBS 394.84]KAF1847746.1 MFS general substrate transporter [Cucurbitaria berberidis CBS 394.84]
MSVTADIEKAFPARNVDDQETLGHHDPNYTFSNKSSQPPPPRHEEDEEEEITRIPTHSSQASRPKKSVLGLAKTITARSCASVIDPGPPPDGGAKAWTQAFMGHFVVFNTWGMIATFGVFQQHYTLDLGLEPSAVSWVGSMQMLGHFSLGILTGRLFDAGYFYWTMIPGMLISAVGMFMTSLCTQYWHFFLAQGVMNGLGNGMQFAPALSLVTTYFSTNRSVALAIMASGSATGGLVYPTIARQLLPRIGFPWTVRAMGFIMLAVGALYCSLLKPRLPPRKSGPMFEFSAFRELPYALFCIAIFLICLGQYFAFYYISSFAVDILHLPYGTSINVLLVLNGIGVLGRLVPSYFADKFTGPYNILIPFCFISAIALFFWPFVKGEAGLFGWCITFGFFVAGFQGIFPSALTTLTKDMSKVGTRNGQGFAVVGLGTFIGPPIAGALIQNYGGGYLVAQMFAGTAVFLGSVILVIGRCSITGWKFKVRA